MALIHKLYNTTKYLITHKLINLMPLAVTHVLITIVLIDLYRHYIAKNSFSRAYVLVAGIAGLLPDADIPLNWIISPLLNIDIHGIFTHSATWGVLFILIGGLIHFSRKKKTQERKKNY